MLSVLSFERIAKKNGVRRISREAVEETREIITELAQELCVHAVSLSRHAKRRTVKEEDVLFAAGSR